jgi:prepilin-type N-terminal cleavage/methylation domain-containing protein
MSTARANVVRRAFTLVELLIVVTILGILAMAVLPAFSGATTEARETGLREQLQRYRTQVLLYRSQHATYPGYFNGDLNQTPEFDVFREQMLSFTNFAGAVNATKNSSYSLGPYLPELPPNPMNGLSTVRVDATGTSTPTPDGSTGWIYLPTNGHLYANLTTSDRDGTPFVRY